MRLLVDLFKYLFAGFCISFCIFTIIGLPGLYIENNSNPLESEMYIEVLELYKNDVLEDVMWTNSSQRAFSPETMTVYADVVINENKSSNLELPYRKFDASFPMYLIDRNGKELSFKFKKELEIRVWN